MYLVEVERAENLASGGDPAFLWGAYLDMPTTSVRSEAAFLEIIGWALGRASRAVAVEMWAETRLMARVPISLERPDVFATFPAARMAATSGFRTLLDVSGREPIVTLEARAVLENGPRITFARIRLRRCWSAQHGPGAGLVSVIIPCYNQAHFLPEAIESALGQTYQSVEVVVIDDGSPDNTAVVAESYPGVRLVRQPNRGLSAARNAGLRASRGEYVVFLDADDRLLPEAVATNLAVLHAHPHAAAAAGRCRYVSCAGSLLVEQELGVVDDAYAALLEECIIGMPGAMLYRRDVFRIIGQFDTAFSASADHELYLRIARHFTIAVHSALIGDYRQHGMSMTQRPAPNLIDRIRMLHAERHRASASRTYRLAYQKGIQVACKTYGRPLTMEVARLWRRREWWRAVRGLWVLARYCPEELRVLRRYLRSFDKIDAVL